MEHTTVKYIIRSLVILETKWNTLLNKIASLVNVPGQHGIVQADGRLDVWSRRQVVKCAVLLHCSSSSRYSNTRSSGDNSSSGISRGRRPQRQLQLREQRTAAAAYLFTVFWARGIPAWCDHGGCGWAGGRAGSVSFNVHNL